VVLFILGYMLYMGVPQLSRELFSPVWTAENQSMLPAIANTFIITVFALLIALPLGIGTAVYLVEYARRDSLAARVITLSAETLSGIPSIVYGLFGFLSLVVALHWGYSLLAGAVTLALMVLPLIISTSREALLSVPQSYREGSLALGAGKTRTLFRIVLPSAAGGILSGVILSLGRSFGETAALLFTSGTGTRIAKSPLTSARTLAVHMYCLLSEGFYPDKAYATGVVLILMVLAANLLSVAAARRLQKGAGR
jgi:phosphate transport system permease protein